MSGINSATIVGRLGQDPEIKVLESGQTLTKFSVATSEKYKKKDGTETETTTWHNIVTWGKLAEICGTYLKKGKQVYLNGKIQNRQYEKDGETRYASEIVAEKVEFLGDAGRGDQANTSAAGQADDKKASAGNSQAKPASAGAPQKPLPNYAPGASNPPPEKAPTIDEDEPLPF